MDLADEKGFTDIACNVFRTNLRRLRRERKLTQLTLANEASISSGLIGDIESGRRNPTLTTISKIAYALKVPTYQLFLPENEVVQLPTKKSK